MTSPMVEQLDLQGVIGEKAKMKSTMVIHIIRINLNQSNEVFTYQKSYLKSVVMRCSNGASTSSVVNGGEKVEYVVRKNVLLYNEFWTDLLEPAVNIERMTR